MAGGELVEAGDLGLRTAIAGLDGGEDGNGMLKLLRKGPVCAGTPGDGSACDARVEQPGARCPGCLEELSTSRDVEARLQAAGQAELPVRLFQLLASDPDGRVRLRIARHVGCPLIVLQRLEGDGDAAVRLAATAAM